MIFTTSEQIKDRLEYLVGLGDKWLIVFQRFLKRSLHWVKNF